MSIDALRAAGKRGLHPSSPVFRVATTDPEAAQGDRKLRFCFSDGSVDRMGDTINPNGWELSDFLANPVALWAHDSSALPIGRASDLAVDGARLMGTIEFAPVETYAFADTVYRLLQGKFLRAVSVGFMPIKYSFVENDPDRGWGIDFEEQELLEISVCPVPANANALTEARSKGIDLAPLVEWIEATLDGDGKTSITKSELQRLRKAAKENTMPRSRSPARRAADDDNDKPDDDKKKATCARGADEECGMSDPSECSVHGKAGKDADGDDDAADDKAIKALIKRLLHGVKRRDADGDGGGDDPDQLPTEHHDAVRLAHKCLRTAKAFSTEAAGLHTKAASLLDGVVSSLKADVEGSDDAGGGDKPEDKSEGDDGDTKPDPDQKAADLAKAEARRKKLRAV